MFHKFDKNFRSSTAAQYIKHIKKKVHTQDIISVIKKLNTDTKAKVKLGTEYTAEIKATIVLRQAF